MVAPARDAAFDSCRDLAQGEALSEIWVAEMRGCMSALGFEPERVFTEHPIQDRTDDEMRIIAEKAYGELKDALLGTRAH